MRYESALGQRALARFWTVFRLSLSIILLGSAPSASISSAQGSASEVQQVQKDVRDLLNALYSGDLDTVIRYTHPRILEMTGGAAVIRPQLAAVVQKLKELGMKIDQMTYPAPPQFVSGGGRRFVVVPTLSLISTKAGDRIESLNFQLGIQDAGSTGWTYVEGSRVNEGNVQMLFPGFPAEFKFPQFYRKKLPKG